MEIPVGGIRGLNIGRLLNNVCTVSLFLRGGGGGGRCLDIFLFFFLCLEYTFERRNMNSNNGILWSMFYSK